MPARAHRLAAWSLVVASLVTSVGACSKSDGSDPERTGPTAQAVERLRDFGLSKGEAECIVDEVGADSVVETTDLNALTESQPYRDAAKACIDGS